MKRKKSNKLDHLREYGKYYNIAFNMLAIILIGVFGGIKLDELLSLTFPIFTLLFSIASVALAIYFAIKDLIKK